MTTILRRAEVQKRTGFPTSTLYLKIKQGEFPKPVKLGVRSVGWPESEVDAFLKKAIEDRDSKVA